VSSPLAFTVFLGVYWGFGSIEQEQDQLLVKWAMAASFEAGFARAHVDLRHEPGALRMSWNERGRLSSKFLSGCVKNWTLGVGHGRISTLGIASIGPLADAMAPCVLFADEIEKALAGATSSGQTDSGVTARVFGSLLTWLNDHESDVFFVGTCVCAHHNHPLP
jgi:hypothetical protein